jgi:hypothetical protein
MIMSVQKWKLVVVGIVKNEASYLDEWIAYHLALGVEHFFLYDNGSDDNTPEITTKYSNAGLLTHIIWPMRGGQVDAYNHAARLLRHTAEWVGFLDADEFMVTHDHDNIYDFLVAAETDQVLVPWRNFPHSGHAVRPGGTAMESYFWAYRNNVDQVVQVKHFVRADKIDMAHPHFSVMTSKEIKVADGSVGKFVHAIANPTYKGAQINHYATRSEAENIARLQKGLVSGSAHKRPDPFHVLTREVAMRHDYDDSILKHFGKYNEEAQRWSAAPRHPHRFGLRQKAPVLPSWNDVVFYFSKSFGNYILGETTILPHTRFRFLRPESDGTDTDVASFLLRYPRPLLLFSVSQEGTSRYFQGSIHYADFVRRYGFKCSYSKRRIDFREPTTCQVAAEDSGYFLILDLDLTAVSTLDIRLPDETRISTNLRPGRFAGSLYLPVCHRGNIQVSMTGNGVIRELLAGTLL